MEKTTDEAFGDVDFRALIEQFGSPLYVYDLDRIRFAIRELVMRNEKTAAKFFYAAKANSNLTVLATIKAAGFSVDAVSPGEIAAAQKAGFSPREITFTPNNAPDDEIRYAVEREIHFTADSLAQLERFGRLYPGRSCAVRMNPEIGGGHHKNVVTGGPDSKFGIDIDDLGEIGVIAARHRLTIDGYHHHIGSGIRDVDLLLSAVDTALEIAPRLGQDIAFVDFGGGFGTTYHPLDRALPLSSFFEKLERRLERFRADRGKDIEFRFQPGRFLVAKAGVLLTTVTAVKRGKKHTFVGVDSGMSHLLRPALYDAYHEVRIFRGEGRPTERVSVTGQICESSDILAKDRRLPQPIEGDILSIHDVGAYGFSMASEYNLRPRPAEVVIDGGKARLSRARMSLDRLLD